MSMEIAKCRVIDVDEIANIYRTQSKDWIDETNIHPKLVGFLANNDRPAHVYAKWTEKSCQQIGIRFEMRHVSRESLEKNIIDANEDPNVGGIMIYYPVFSSGHDQYIQNCVSPYKDVEGLCHTFRFNMYHNIRFIDINRKSILPCTPLAIVKILDHLNVYDHKLDYGDQLTGKTITIVNRSEVVGRPLAALLANDGAKVYSVDIDDVVEFFKASGNRKHSVCDSKLELKDVLPLSDVVISGVPSDKFKIDVNNLKDGVVAINFSSNKNFPANIVDRASIYVPAIGKMTIAMLQRNLIRLYDYQINAN